MSALHWLNRLLADVIADEGTDLFLTVGSPPMAAVDADLVALEETPVGADALEGLLLELLTEERQAAFAKKPDLDLPHVVPGAARFRVNVFRQRGKPGLVARRIRTDIQSLQDLGVPPILASMSQLRSGLVLVTGATGSGKSTTLAAMIDHRNETMPGHIVTIEDPIEFTHEHKRSLVTQREVGTDTLSYADALRSALRQAPSVILIGEIRDREAAEAALHMAETGHLVLATLHSTNAIQTCERLVGLFGKETRPQILALLSVVVGGVISQRLLRRKHDADGRVAALEVLVPTARVRDLIGRGDLDPLREAMVDAEGHDGMQTFDEALVQLVVSGTVSVQEALAHSDSPSDLRLRLRGEAEKRGFARRRLQEQGLRLL